MIGMASIRSRREPDELALVSGGDGSPAPGPEATILPTPGLASVYRTIERVARARLAVALVGETGVGKEHVAELLHRQSARARHPFVRINCAAITGALFESELFGYEAGAFTGAVRARAGWLEAAAQGTVLLDEVAELPLDLQPKLLRALDTGAAPRVGGGQPRPFDARFVAATNQDLEVAVERGTFRQDLYFRLAGISLTIPPLRCRPDDILVLADHFVRLHPGVALSDAARAALLAHPWPGNVRELRNVIERAALFAENGVIDRRQLQLDADAATPPPRMRLREVRPYRAVDNRARVLEILAACGGNQTRAAFRLGIGVRTLCRWLDELAIPRPRRPARGR